MSCRPLILLLVQLLLVGTVRAQQPSVVPEKGEGIYRLLSRNGIEASNAVVAEFREMNDGKLTRDGGLRTGVSYKLPGAMLMEPLFGDELQYVERISDRLAGKVFYCISGHGGDDPGAGLKLNGKWIREDEYAYDVMLRFARLLMSHGATVYIMTRDDDGIRDGEYLEPDTDERHYDGKLVRGERNRLYGRTDEINRLAKKHGNAYQRVVEFHIDSHIASKRLDIDFYYWTIAGERLARALSAKMAEKYDEVRPGRGYNGRVLKKGWHTIKQSKPLVAYIELGNIQNKSDRYRILQYDNRQLVAEWVLEGFLEDASGK